MRRAVGSALLSLLVVAMAVAVSRHIAWRAGRSFLAGTEGRFGGLKIAPEVGLWHAYPPWGEGDLQLWRIDGCDGVDCSRPILYLSATGRIVGANPPGLKADLEEMRAQWRAETQGDLARLLRGQELEVRVRKDGCFGSDDSAFVFSRSAGGDLSVMVQARTAKTAGRAVPRVRQLTEPEARTLDRELRLARSAVANGCTLRSTFDLTVREGSQIVGEDHFVDSGCSFLRLDDRPLLEQL